MEITDTATHTRETVTHEPVVQVDIVARMAHLSSQRTALEILVQELEGMLTSPHVESINALLHQLNDMHNYFSHWEAAMNLYKELVAQPVQVAYQANKGILEIKALKQSIRLFSPRFFFKKEDQLADTIGEWIEKEVQDELQKSVNLLERVSQALETLSSSNAVLYRELDGTQCEQIKTRFIKMKLSSTVGSAAFHIEEVRRILPERVVWQAQMPIDHKGNWKDGGTRPYLPIVDKIPDLIHALEIGQIVILQSATGTGKTTLATAAIQQAFSTVWRPEAGVQVHSCQPTRAAVEWIGRTVAAQGNGSLGEKVACILKGRKGRGEQGLTPGPNSELVFEVNQTMLNRILKEVRDHHKLPDGVLFLDEAHLGQKALFIAMVVIKYYLPYSPNTRVVITSATLNKNLYADYCRDKDTCPEGGTIVEVEPKGGVVDIQPVPFEDGHHRQWASRVATNILSQMQTSEQYLMRGEKTTLSPHEAQRLKLFSIIAPLEAGDILTKVSTVGPEQQEYIIKAAREVITSGSIAVMVAGKEDVATVLGDLARKAQFFGLIDDAEWEKFNNDDPRIRIVNNAKVQIIHLHGETHPQIRDITQTSLKPGQKRFVIATGDIIRNSVTIPNLVGLVDSLEVKRNIVNEKGANVLRKIPVTYAEMLQAMGRLSRIRLTIKGRDFPIPGNYYPLEYNGIGGYTDIKAKKGYPAPEICQSSLTSPALWLASVGLSIRHVDFPFTAVEKIPEKTMNDALLRLKKIGAIHEDETITPFGKKLLRFDLEPELAASLFKAGELGVLSETVIATAAVNAERPIHSMPKDGAYLLLNEDEVRKLIAYANKAIDKTLSLEDVLDRSWVTRDRDLYKIELRKKTFFDPERVFNYFWKEHFAQNSSSDFVALVNAYREYKKAAKGRTIDSMQGWLMSHCLHVKSFQEFVSQLEDLLEQVRSSELSLDEDALLNGDMSGDKIKNLHIAIAAGSVDNVGLKGREYYSSPATGQKDYKPDNWSACPANVPLMVYGGMPRELQKGTVVQFAAPISPEDLLSAMPHLIGERLKKDSLVFKPSTGAVHGIYDTVYHNAVIGTYTKTVEGPSAASTIAWALIREGAETNFNTNNLRFIKEVYDLSKGKGVNILQVSEWIQGDLKRWYEVKMIQLGLSSIAQLNLHEQEFTLTEEILEEIGITNFPAKKARIEAERPDTCYIQGETYPLEYKTADTSRFDYKAAGVYLKLPIRLNRRIKNSELPDISGLKTYVTFFDQTGKVIENVELESTYDIEKRPPELIFNEKKLQGLFNEDGTPDELDGLELSFNKGRDGEKRTYPVKKITKLSSGGWGSVEYEITIIRDGKEETFKLLSLRPLEALDKAFSRKVHTIKIVNDLIKYVSLSGVPSRESIMNFPGALKYAIQDDMICAQVMFLLQYRLNELSQKEEATQEDKETQQKISKIIEELEKKRNPRPPPPHTSVRRVQPGQQSAPEPYMGANVLGALSSIGGKEAVQEPAPTPEERKKQHALNMTAQNKGVLKRLRAEKPTELMRLLERMLKNKREATLAFVAIFESYPGQLLKKQMSKDELDLIRGQLVAVGSEAQQAQDSDFIQKAQQLIQDFDVVREALKMREYFGEDDPENFAQFIRSFTERARSGHEGEKNMPLSELAEKVIEEL